MLPLIAAAWYTVATDNCYWSETPSCKVQEDKESRLCHRGDVCLMFYCGTSRKYCDEIQIGLMADRTTTWRIVTSTETWNAEMSKALKEANK